MKRIEILKKISTIEHKRVPYIDLGYICEDCGEEFYEPRWVEHQYGECWGMPAYDRDPECPCCGSDNFTYYKDHEEERAENARFEMRENRLRGKVYRVIA